MRLLLLHTALLATIAIAAPASAPDCGRGGYNSWGDDGSTCAEVDTNAGRKGYNGVDEDSSSKRSPDADANRGHSGYNGWDGASAYADFGRRWHRGRDSQRGSCDLKNAVMPAGKPNIHFNTHIHLI